MLPGVLPAVDAHYRRMQALQAVAVLAGRRAWKRIDEQHLSESWRSTLLQLSPVVGSVQLRAAEAGAEYGAQTLADQGMYEPPESFVNPAAFVGFASDGRSLAGLLYSPVTTAKSLIQQGYDVRRALAVGESHLDTILRTQVADVGRQSSGVDIATRPGTGYVRMLNPPSCSRCVILAGRFYRWNAGFRRHPKCDCVHVGTSAKAAESEGLVSDPYEYFQSLSETEQNRLFGRENARAIRDGADIYQVENRRLRGATSTTAARSGFGRLTPESIYKQAGSREEALRLLEREGYILPGGQVPGGVIRGQREGFGELGRGGTRVGAREAVLRAREAGVRDPFNRATMTAAERRFFDAQLNWDAVLAGKNPYQRWAKLTPKVAARAEAEYRRFIATNGEIFTR